MASKHRYSEVEKQWLKDNFSNYSSVKFLTEDFNQVFGTNLSVSAIRQQCVNYLGISFGAPQVDWSKEEDDFLLQNYGKYTFKELSEMIFHRFGRKVTWMGVRSHCYKTLGLTLENPGKFAYRWKQLPVGTERIICGYTWVKVNNIAGKRGEHNAYRQNWKMKHQIIWEEAHGPVPDGCQVIFLDGDRTNFNLDNLCCIDILTFMQMTGNNFFRLEDVELRKTAIKLSELRVLLSGRSLRNL